MDTEVVWNKVKVTLEFLWEFVLLFGTLVYFYTERIWRLFVPRPLKSLDGEIILLTGSGNGIGKQIARELANKGATLVCWDNEGDANNRTVEELKRSGTKAYAYTVDISEKQNIVKAAEMVRADVGDVTIVINNAGIAPNGPFLEEREDLLEKMFHVNILSHMWILRQFLPKMIERGQGHVVTTASLSAFIPCRDIAAYAATKHAVHGFIDSLRQEIQIHPKKPDIKFTTIYPSFVNTRLMDGITLQPKYKRPDTLSVEYVGQKIVEGFRQNYEHIYLPPYLSILAFLSLCLPQRVLQQIQTGLMKIDVQREIPNGNTGSKKHN